MPIDPEYPRERVEFMLQDAGVPVLLTQSRLADSLGNCGSMVVCVDKDIGQSGKESGNPAVQMGPDNLAYMIYTSGSTGKPKGAMNTHRGICNRLLWMQDRYNLTRVDSVIQKTPCSFDVSVWEFFWPLLAGARLVLASPGGHRDSAYLVKLITEQHITVAHFVPSMLRIFLEDPAVQSCRSLRHVICSGEALPFDLQELFFNLLSAELHNLYGPTEAAVDVTSWACQRNSERKIVPIGRPIANTQVYVLDRHMQPVPMGVPGELYIGGVQVGRGYHNRPDLTEERFIRDPFTESPNARLYKTGDLCRWLGDGSVEYLGRMDLQVKIRGFRIELGEIETVLRQHSTVKSCLVAAREDVPGERSLSAYVVWQEEHAYSIRDVRDYLSQRLPNYMVPQYFVTLAALPLTANGKVDRSAIPAPGADASDDMHQAVALKASDDEIERAIAGIWQKVLGICSVDIDSNFFDLGGDSLRLNRVRVRLQQAFHKEVTMLELLQYATVRRQAERIRGNAGTANAPRQSDAEIEQRRDAATRRRQSRRRILGGDGRNKNGSSVE